MYTIKKTKSKEKQLSRIHDNMSLNAGTASDIDRRPAIVDQRTKAEIAFDKAKERKVEQQILDKATKSHKERILEFNQHLDNLTEHFDIPKVSWTK